MSLRDLNQISIERDILETSFKHPKRDDFFVTSLIKTSQKHLKKDVFSVTSLGRLKNISRIYLSSIISHPCQNLFFNKDRLKLHAATIFIKKTLR